MRCPTLSELPSPSCYKNGWPWSEECQQLQDTMPGGKIWPRVSIVMPSYNQADFIEESIRSVLLQGYPDLEFIIIDNCSTDGTLDIVRKYEKWLSFWVSEPDQGQSNAINKGLAKCTGTYFNWQNSDDVLLPNSFAKMAEAMSNHPEASYAYGYEIVIDEDGNILYNRKDLFDNKKGLIVNIEPFIVRLTGGFQPGSLMDLNLVKRVGGIDERLSYVMDAELGLRLAFIKPPISVDEPVVCCRIHSNAKTYLLSAKRAKERLLIARKLFKDNSIPGGYSKLKRKVFGTAHEYAWKNYAAEKIYWRVLWHAFMDDVCSRRIDFRLWASWRAFYQIAREMFTKID